MEAVLTLLSSEDVIRGIGDVLRNVEAGTRSLIRYLAPQLELESDLVMENSGGLAERPKGWNRGRLNDDGGGDGDCDDNANAIIRRQKRVAYE